MPIAEINGVSLHYEEAGTGFPIVFCHELASDCRAWDAAVERLSPRYRCIRFNMRGYPPSCVPSRLEDYAHEMLVDDLRQLMEALGIATAHVIGVATGGGLALNLALQRPDMVTSLVAVGPGAGAVDREAWLKGAAKLAADVRLTGASALAASMLVSPQRVALRSKDFPAWNRFLEGVCHLSAVGCANMIENAMMRRKTIRELEPELVKLQMPVLVAVGDQDMPAFEACVLLSRSARYGALAVFPFTGHMIPLEEPELFDRIVSTFLAAVDCGRWGNWSSAANLAKP